MARAKKNIDIEYLPKSFEIDENKHINIAIIIPYRNRKSHLNRFFNHISHLDSHSVLYDIYVIEQDNNEKFNRGLLLNIGYISARKVKNYDRYIFHDVDSYPDQVLFSQYGLFVDKTLHYASPYLGYKYNYERFVGGVIGISGVNFEKINGFSTIFFGWGGEDDSLYTRMAVNSIPLYRPSVGRYDLVEHAPPTDAEYNTDKRKNLNYDSKHWKKNGLTQLLKLHANDAKYNFVGESEFFDSAMKKNDKLATKIISPDIRCFFVKAEFSINKFAAPTKRISHTTRSIKIRKSRKTKSVR